MIEWIPIVLLFVLLFLGVPIAYSLLSVGVLGLVIAAGPGGAVGFLQTRVYGTVASFSLVTVPMFLLMAELLRESGLTTIIYEAFDAWLGHFRGGLAVSTVFASGGLAALSGSSAATAATMSSVAVPEMRKHGYGDRLSLGTVSAAGTFASMIPPSIILIIYGITTETSIPKLFAAGVIPGILTIVGYIAMIYYWSYSEPSIIGGEPPDKASLSRRLESVKPLGPPALIVIIAVGALFLGVVTPSESGALGAAGVLVVGVLFSNLRTQGIVDASANAVETTAMIFMLLIGATIFGLYLTLTGIADVAISTIAGLAVPALVIIFLLMLIYLALGTIMTGIPILLLTLPLTYPIVTDLGFSSIWFGILVVKALEMGLVSPPFGLNVFIATGAVDVDPGVGFRGAVRFLFIDFAILITLLLVPGIAMWLPNQI